MAGHLPTEKRIHLLATLAEVLSECYNANIQNHGAGGIWESEGRSFDYPIRFHLEITPERKAQIRQAYSYDERMLKWKLKREAFTESVTEAKKDDKVFMSGHFAFGANELPIMHNLDRVLRYLEEHHGLVIDEADENK